MTPTLLEGSIGPDAAHEGLSGQSITLESYRKSVEGDALAAHTNLGDERRTSVSKRLQSMPR